MALADARATVSSQRHHFRRRPPGIALESYSKLHYYAYKMTRREEASRLRQRLRNSERRLSSLIGSLTAERGPMVRGVFQFHGTRCGKPNCKCVQGELHPTAVLAVSEKGRRRNIYVRLPDRTEIQQRSERYRRFRQSRAEIARLGAEILNLADELLDALADPYLPQQRRQGRKRTKTRRKGAR